MASVKSWIKRWLQWIRLYYLASHDLWRFARHASLSTFDRDVDRLTARIMYNVHAIEKGLARNTDFRPGFGEKALRNLNTSMVMYRMGGHDTNAFAYSEGLGVIEQYIALHEGLGHSVEFLDTILDQTLLAHVEPASTRAGTIVVAGRDKSGNRSKDFAALSQGRTSVREFSGEPIDEKKVEEALALALKSPSVCNRQGWRVHWISDKQMMDEVLRHQRGFGYQPLPEVLLCITVSTTAFVSPVERNQAFVDGGLYSMSVLYGLEYEGLAAVPLNACLYASAQRAVRRIVGIPESEAIIMFVAIGAFPDQSKAPASSRKPLPAVLVRH